MQKLTVETGANVKSFETCWTLLLQQTARFVFFLLPDLLRKIERKAAARKYPTCLDIYGCRELELSEAKGKFTFALKRDKEKMIFKPEEFMKCKIEWAEVWGESLFCDLIKKIFAIEMRIGSIQPGIEWAIIFCVDFAQIVFQMECKSKSALKRYLKAFCNELYNPA